mmetsp:Transcript_4117/g.18308  ORF Transcript_4117/g.18308 Transcript_4117/m.18308 type:complete len:230 (-) Transcript_4117:584-1273(-)
MRVLHSRAIPWRRRWPPRSSSSGSCPTRELTPAAFLRAPLPACSRHRARPRGPRGRAARRRCSRPITIRCAPGRGRRRGARRRASAAKWPARPTIARTRASVCSARTFCTCTAPARRSSSRSTKPPRSSALSDAASTTSSTSSSPSRSSSGRLRTSTRGTASRACPRRWIGCGKKGRGSLARTWSSTAATTLRIRLGGRKPKSPSRKPRSRRRVKARASPTTVQAGTTV